MIWKALVKEHNLGAVIYTIEIKERIIRMKRINLTMRGQEQPIIKMLIALQKKEKDYCII